MSTACDIIIPAWNHLEETRNCLKSVFENTGYPYRIILVDNASDEGTKAYFEEVAGAREEVILIRNADNIGFVKAVNQGLARSDTDFICILNNDTVVTKGWLAECVEVLRRNPGVALVNPSSNNLGQRPAPGETVNGYAAKLAGESGWIELGAAIGFCLLMRRGIKERFGGFDEAYGMGNFEDTDYSRRVQRAGMKCVRAKGAYVYHKEGASFRRGKKHDAAFGRNREIFEKRWGRPRRVLYVLRRPVGTADADVIKADCERLAGRGNWVWLFIKSGIPWDMKEHSNIRPFFLPEIFFDLNVRFRILKRKKRFDEVKYI